MVSYLAVVVILFGVIYGCWKPFLLGVVGDFGVQNCPYNGKIDGR
jgi:hypothetical protein